MQQEISLGTNIKAVLIELRNNYGVSNREIAERICVSESYLSNVFNGGKEGSEQLLAGLRLLKRVIELENQPPPKTNRELILELAERVAMIEKGLKIAPYPPHRSQASVLNEGAAGGEASSGPEPDPEFLALARRSMEILGVPLGVATPPSAGPKPSH